MTLCFTIFHLAQSFRIRRLRSLAWMLLIPTVGPAAAQAEGSNSVSVVMILAIALAAVTALAAYLFVSSRRRQKQLVEQSENLALVTGERDEALERLQEKTREIEEDLGVHIHDLEEKNQELSAATARLRKLVVIDELTQLSNRLHFDQVMPHEIKRALREEKALSLIFGRFDWADAYRQSYGEDRFGEAMLKIADEMRTIFRRAGDLPARYGTDTFAIIFTSDGDVAERFAQRLRKSVWNIPIPHDASETADRVTFSIGVATVMPDKIHNPADVVAAAETAARIASEQGGNKVERYRNPPSQPAAV